MPPTVTNMGTKLHATYFGHHEREQSKLEKDLYPNFKASLAVVKDAPPRLERFEYTVNLGKMNIERLFSRRPLQISRDGSIFFMFPERWMSVHEQRTFMFALNLHEDAERVSSVYVVTSSPIIIGEFYKTQILVFTFGHEFWNGEELVSFK